jgi:hypothetical protein
LSIHFYIFNLQQGYSTPISTSMATDPYMSNYYGTTSFPYQAFGVGDGTWSNGGDPMTFLGSYGGQMAAAAAAHDTYNMEGMFGTGGFGAFNQPAGTFNYFPGSSAAAAATDYSTWGGGAAGGGAAGAGLGRKQHYEEYYRAAAAEGAGVYAMQADDRVKTVEQGMQGLGLSEKDKDKENKDQQQQQQGSATTGTGGGGGGIVVVPTKKLTWASVASTPAKPQPQIKKKAGGLLPPPMLPGKHNMDIGTWEGKNGAGQKPVAPPPAPRTTWGQAGPAAVPMRGPQRGGPLPQMGPPQQAGPQYAQGPVGPGMAVAPPGVMHHPMHPPQGDYCEY